jgi:hypothetical protein
MVDMTSLKYKLYNNKGLLKAGFNKKYIAEYFQEIFNYDVKQKFEETHPFEYIEESCPNKLYFFNELEGKIQKKVTE